MALLGKIFLKNFHFIPTGNYIRPVFSSFLSTKVDVYERVKELNIPEKPKKPGNTYLLFVKNINEKLRKENPELSMPRILQKCGEIWKTMDPMEKEKYKQEFSNVQKQYAIDLQQYQQSLTPEQKSAVKALEKEIDNVKKSRKLKKELIELKKPKKPLGTYALFLSELHKTGNVAVTISKENAEMWKNLTEAQRQVYIDKVKAAREQYEKDLQIWEKEMIQLGRHDLVRKEVLDKIPVRKSRILKYGTANTEHDNTAHIKTTWKT